MSAKPLAPDLDVRESLRQTAALAARSAGALLLDAYGRPLAVDREMPHDLKLEVDRRCETLILGIIRDQFPAHAVLSEETGYLGGSSPFLWIVDPLDGTVNYFHQLPFFCTSVACYRLRNLQPPAAARSRGADRHPAAQPSLADLEPLAAAVYCPLSNELFEGIRGGGAYLNGEPLVASPVRCLGEAMVSIAFSASDGDLGRMSARLPALAGRARKIRSLGCTALEIVHVAAGRIGVSVQGSTNLWDFAAGAIVVSEAGGSLETRAVAAGRYRVVAANPGIAVELARMLEEA